jgi:hypothetical protein
MLARAISGSEPGLQEVLHPLNHDNILFANWQPRPVRSIIELLVFHISACGTGNESIMNKMNYILQPILGELLAYICTMLQVTTPLTWMIWVPVFVELYVFVLGLTLV